MEGFWGSAEEAGGGGEKFGAAGPEGFEGAGLEEIAPGAEVAELGENAGRQEGLDGGALAPAANAEAARDVGVAPAPRAATGVDEVLGAHPVVRCVWRRGAPVEAAPGEVCGEAGAEILEMEAKAADAAPQDCGHVIEEGGEARPSRF